MVIKKILDGEKENKADKIMIKATFQNIIQFLKKIYTEIQSR